MLPWSWEALDLFHWTTSSSQLGPGSQPHVFSQAFLSTGTLHPNASFNVQQEVTVLAASMHTGVGPSSGHA